MSYRWEMCLERGELPSCEQDARKIVIENEKLEILDGVLHHDNAADPICSGVL